MASGTVNALLTNGPNVLSGQPANFAVVYTNTGSSAVVINSVTVAGANLGFYVITPPALPPNGEVVNPGAAVALQSIGNFYPNLSPSLLTTFQLQWTVNFADGSSIQSGYVTVSPLINSPGAATFYLPTNSGVLSVFGM